MYKSRITSWGLDKKLKGDEILAVLRVRADREIQGKKTEFWTARGSRLDMADIERYLQRNPSMLMRFHAGAEPSHEAMKRIICRTPSPEPQADMALSVPLAEEERTLRIIAEYISSSLEAGIKWEWRLNKDCGARRPGAMERLEMFRGNAYLASECYYAGDRQHVISFANLACATLRDLLLDEHPKLISTLCRLISLIRGYVVPDFLVEIGRFAVNLSSIVLGPEHPISLVLVYLFKNLANEKVWDWAQRMFHMSWERFEAKAGEDNYFLVHLFRDYRQSMFMRPHFFKGVEKELVSWMVNHPSSGATTEWLNSQMYQHRAWNEVGRGRIDEAEKNLQMALRHVIKCQEAGWPVQDLMRVQHVIQAEVSGNKTNQIKGLGYVEALKMSLHMGDAGDGMFSSICQDLEHQWRAINQHKRADQLIPLRPLDTPSSPQQLKTGSTLKMSIRTSKMKKEEAQQQEFLPVSPATPATDSPNTPITNPFESQNEPGTKFSIETIVMEIPQDT